jgi:prepilin-type N-terminal cleavage/methylation domain-containing protein
MPFGKTCPALSPTLETAAFSPTPAPVPVSASIESLVSDMFMKKLQGFTLLELLIVLALLGLLVATLFPALANSKPHSHTLQCLNNNRRLCMAWRMYADDNRDQLVYSSDDGTGASNSSNQYAWVQSHLDFNPSNPGNWDPSFDIMKGPLWRYSGNDSSIDRCPSDRSFVVVNGVARPRVRSMAMNLYLGGFAGTMGGLSFVPPYLYTKLTEIGGSLPTPGPAKLWIFQDVRPDSINWGNFYTDMTGYAPTNPSAYTFSDFPGMYHNGAAVFSFADSHCEVHKWLDPRTMPAPLLNGQIDINFPSPRNVDIAWLQDHSTRPK